LNTLLVHFEHFGSLGFVILKNFNIDVNLHNKTNKLCCAAQNHIKVAFLILSSAETRAQGFLASKKLSNYIFDVQDPSYNKNQVVPPFERIENPCFFRALRKVETTFS
jgi:hypothetical protein